tara:strand:+ start:316 stop:645 length:330 start_codon:yes stop_codon:yes gene_type:complete
MNYYAHSDLRPKGGTLTRGGRKVFKVDSKVMMTDEEMKKMSDAELRRKYRDVIAKIEEARQNNRSTKDLEIEYCYMYRELEGRQRWRDKHRPEKMSRKFIGRPHVSAKK